MAQPQTTSTATTPPRQIAAPAFQVSSLRASERYLRMLVYGKPGAGKTTLMASAADVTEMNDVFMINAEAGDMSILDNPLISNIDSIDVAKPVNYRQFVKMYEYLSAHHNFRDVIIGGNGDVETATQKLALYEATLKGTTKEEIIDNGGPRLYKTVIIDSITDIERMAMDNFLGAGDTPGMIDISEDVKVAEFKEYKQVNNTLNRVIRAFRYMPYNLLVVAAADYSQNELKQYVWNPSMTGKLSSQVQGYFDIVGFLVPGREGEKTIRRLWLQPDAKWDAKCRRAALKEPFLDNAMMSTIMTRCGLTGASKASRGG